MISARARSATVRIIPAGSTTRANNTKKGVTLTNKRTLGAQGLQVSAIGLGFLVMSQSYGPSLERLERILFIRGAVEAGVTFFVTAESHGLFVNEELPGQALSSLRDRVVIATRFGFAFDDDGRNIGVSSRPEHIKAAADASLARLGVEAIDLYYQHRVDPQVPIEEVAGTPLRHVRSRVCIPWNLVLAVPDHPFVTRPAVTDRTSASVPVDSGAGALGDC